MSPGRPLPGAPTTSSSNSPAPGPSRHYCSDHSTSLREHRPGARAEGTHSRQPPLKLSPAPGRPRTPPRAQPSRHRAPLRPAPRTPAPQRLGHEILPGLPLPADQQHQARDSSLRSHAAAFPPPSRIPPAPGPRESARAAAERAAVDTPPPPHADGGRGSARRTVPRGAPSERLGPAQSLTSSGHNHSLLGGEALKCRELSLTIAPRIPGNPERKNSRDQAEPVCRLPSSGARRGARTKSDLVGAPR